MQWLTQLFTAPTNIPTPGNHFILQIENAIYQPGDTLRLATSINPTTSSKKKIQQNAISNSYVNNFSSSTTSNTTTTSAPKEIKLPTPTIQWDQVHAIQISLHGSLHLLRPAATILSSTSTSISKSRRSSTSSTTSNTTSSTTSSTTTFILHNSTIQTITSSDLSLSERPLTPGTSTIASFVLPTHLPPTYRGHYISTKYFVRLVFLNKSNQNIMQSTLRIPIVLRGSKTTVVDSPMPSIAPSSLHTVSYLSHSLFDPLLMDSRQEQNTDISKNDTSVNNNNNNSNNNRSITISHLRICSHEDEVVESDNHTYQSIPHHQQRLNTTATFSAKTNSNNQQVFITLHNSKPKASESITLRFDYIHPTICTFTCVALLQYETLQFNNPNNSTNPKNTIEKGTEDQPQHTDVRTLASWHETTTSTMSSWCSLTIPENILTFKINNQKNNDCNNPTIEIRHTLKCQFHLKGATTPMTCEVPIHIHSEWRPTATTTTTSTLFNGNGGGTTRWCVLK